jgi:dolichyl-phosphate-mannose-protein mannosyltransferase
MQTPNIDNADLPLSPTLKRLDSWNWQLIGGSLGILALSLALRLWHLNSIPFPVFDEVFFPKYAEEYLNGAPTWEGHPPLSKYLIMLGIQIFGHNEIGYRIASAIFGSLIPILAIGIVYRISQAWKLAILSGLFVLADGLFLVESRLGLINVFLVVFGLVAQIFLLAGLERQGIARTLYLCFSGIMLGASASVKWNGLGFGLMFFLLGIMVWTITLFFPNQIKQLGILSRVTQLRWWQYLLCFVLMPLAFYTIQWIPLLMLNSGGIAQQPGFGAIASFWQSFVAVHQHIIWWHNSSAVVQGDATQAVHPYCSAWASWPVLARPIDYFFNVDGDKWTDIHALGNPILWWLSTASIVGLSVWGLKRFQAIAAYVLLGYAANYLPWLITKRCLFIYHYMSAALFSFIGLAFLTYMLLKQPKWRYLGIAVIVSVVICQIFFMPIWLGLPLTSQGFYQRMWFMPNQVPGFNWI